MTKPTNIGGLKSLGKATKPVAHVSEFSVDAAGGTMPKVPRPGKIGGGDASTIFGKGRKV